MHLLKLSLLPLVCALTACTTNSLGTMQVFANTEISTMQSEATGHQYHIIVRLPPDYDPAQSYPLVVLLDGGTMMPQLAGHFHYLRFSDSVPAAILVGISYGSDRFADGNYRASDYTAPAASAAHWGDAPKFLDFLDNELLPKLQVRYAIQKDRQVLFGQSLGGQFVLFAALHAPNLFHGYIASNPALHRNLSYFTNQVGGATGPARGWLIMTMGEFEAAQFRPNSEQFAATVQAQTSLPWAFRFIPLTDEDHFSAAPRAFRKGLSIIFPVNEQSD